MIRLVRCDDRLIHGQCIVRVITDFNIEKILIIDDFVACNQTLKSIFMLAVPPQIKANILKSDEASAVIYKYLNNDDKVMILLKSPEVALKLFDMIPELKKELNIGPMSNRKQTTKATSYAYLLENEAAAIRTLAKMGVRVYFNQVLGQKVIEWKEIESEFS
jgi:mannose/fructose/N-acetylgalactosamine-specific phosphotransferase system component IIB